MNKKRRDNKGRVLLMGEWQDENGRYRYKYTDALGKRKTLYSWRLTEADKTHRAEGMIYRSVKRREKYNHYICKESVVVI